MAPAAAGDRPELVPTVGPGAGIVGRMTGVSGTTSGMGTGWAAAGHAVTITNASAATHRLIPPAYAREEPSRV